jgi:S1-C subfamily serine protease
MHLLAMSKVDLQKHLLAIVLLASLTPYHVAYAQRPLHLPGPEIAIPGVAQKSPISAPTIDKSAYAALSTAEALATQFKDAIPHTRGGQDVVIFREAAPSVVLILTNDASGSGSLLQGNLILTSLHVVDHNREVTVVFKPENPNGKANADEVVKGDIVKVDVQRDLALIRPRSLPRRSIHTLEISTQDIEVGADVHAIGHPLRQDWTYTKGVVSSVRPDYEWAYGAGDRHRGTIIQTQTPLNPGNSGGPLLSDDGKIVGVNLFVAKGAEGINFAVAAKEIRFFLNNADDGMAAVETCNQSKILFEGRNRDNNAFIRMASLRCDDTADVTFVWPDNKREPIYAVFDVRRRGKPNGIVFDLRRSGKWDVSYWESELFDGTFSWRGVHPNGELIPKSFVPRCGARKPLPEFKCAA